MKDNWSVINMDNWSVGKAEGFISVVDPIPFLQLDSLGVQPF